MRYMQQYGLTAYAAEQLTAERWLAEYFERAAGLAESPVALCNLILGRGLCADHAAGYRAYRGARPGGAAHRPGSTWRRSAT